MISRWRFALSFLLPLLTVLATMPARAEDESPAPVEAAASTPEERAPNALESTLDNALDLLGIRYRWGGNRPETGFDCSGFVRYVFRESLGIELPRSAREISRSGEPIARDQLQPGDLVFFNTMRRAFSHVGIYLGENLFVHAPHRGSRVRVDDLTTRYWFKRFNGARRLTED